MSTATLTRPALPAIESGATINNGRDRSPATVIAASGKRVTVQMDNYTAMGADNGHSESQSYSYTRNEEGSLRQFSLRKNGSWIPVGQELKHGATTISFGSRERYYDPTF